ncbi:MAG: tetratricopeptide repeat protein [Candidatus Wallbacteria bacterium]|nr:tetratricopeptide repeat protein [Candidatus Wallbacteria bacterium]
MLDQAFDIYQQILADHPDHTGSHVNSGIVLYLMGEFPRALACLERAVEYDPSDAGARYNRAKVLAAMDRNDEALEQLLVARELDPRDLLTTQEICRTYLRMRRYDGFFEAVAEGLEQHPQDPALYILKAQAFLEKGDQGRAADLLNLLLNHDPSLEAALTLLAEVYLQTNRIDKAVATVKRALLKNPDSAELHKKLGVCYSLRGDRQLARGELARALELDPTIIVTIEAAGGVQEEKPEKWDALKFQGYILARSDYYARTGAWRSAVNEFLLLARKYPDRPIILQELASAYQNSGEYRRAYAIYRRVLQMEPENLEVQLQLSRLALAIGRISEARKFSEHSAASYPEVSEVAEIQGQVCLEANDLERAREAFTRAIERSHSNLDALMGLGTCHFRAGDFKAARDVWEQAHKLFPGSIKIALCLADAQVELGQKVAAIKLLRETKHAAAAAGAFARVRGQTNPSAAPPSGEVPAVSGSPVELLHRLGSLYLECGWPKKARAEWRDLKELWSGDPREAVWAFEAMVFFRDVREALRTIRAWLARHAATPEIDFLLMLCHVMLKDQTKFWISWQKVWKEKPTLFEARANFLKAVLSRGDVQFLLSKMPRTQALFSSHPDAIQQITALEDYLGRIQAIEPITELNPDLF